MANSDPKPAFQNAGKRRGQKGENIMRIIHSLVQNVLGLLEKGGEVDARISDAEKYPETEEQQFQRRAEIQRALEDMRRHERVMTGRP